MYGSNICRDCAGVGSRVGTGFGSSCVWIEASTSVDHSILALYERLSSTYAANKADDAARPKTQMSLDLVSYGNGIVF
eukprot:91217-Amphidinium_carterae.1